MRIRRSRLRWVLFAVTGLMLAYAGPPNPLTFMAAFLLVLVGQYIQLTSYTVLIKNEVLTKSGPYAIVRNPFYVGTFFVDLGIYVLSGVWFVAAIYFPVMSFVYYRRTIREEQSLRRSFEQEYDDYVRQIPRFIPNFGVLLARPLKGVKVDPSLLIRNRLLPRIMNLWAAMIILVGCADIKWRGDAVYSMDHVTLIMVCIALLMLAVFLGRVGKQMGKAA